MRTFSTPAAGELLSDEPEAYSIEGAIGAGGMGAVLSAKSSRLGRAVALKVITMDRPDLLRRFAYETQITARLQHPAIVPVYGSGRSKDGQPFYAMKQVTGEPLDRVIAAANTFAKRVALLPNVIAVTEAIAYAHSQRVIHRDLKPANILVGAFGETVVIDWGLAKDLSRVDDETIEEASPYRTRGDATAIGKVMGTPAFMPLEQARGEAIDERADVYALGAILYHLIAGRAPYARPDEDGAPWETVLARVLDAPPASLATLQPDAPPDLLAIVRRAMARDAADRYATATQLAADLRRFQTGQLVGAHRYSTWQLVRRWVRRHRAAVTVGAILVAAIAVVSVLSVQRIRAERSVAQTERGVAQTQRAAAIASKGEVEDLMGYMLGDLKDKLEPVGKLAILDSVAQRAIAYYDAHPDATSDPDLRQRALAYMSAGQVIQSQGRLDDALALYRRALAIRDTLGAKPGNVADLTDAANSHFLIGDVLDFQGKPEDALAEYHEGLAVATRGAASPSPSVAARLMVSRGHDELGDIEVTLLKSDLAEQDLQAALALQRPLVAEAPTDPQVRRGLGTSLVKLGVLYQQAGDLAKANDTMKEAIAVTDALAAEHPELPELVRRSAIAHQIQGTILIRLGRLAGVDEHRAAVAAADRLVMMDPFNTEWTRTAMACRSELAKALGMAGDQKGAIAELKTAIASQQVLVAHDNSNLQWKGDLATLQHALAQQIWGATHDIDQAMPVLLAAITLREALVKQDPAATNFARNLASDHQLLGDLLSVSDDEAKVRVAIEHYEAALAVYRDLATREPKNADFARLLASGLYGLGDTYARLGDAHALPMLADARARYAALAKQDPTNADPSVSMVYVDVSVAIAQLHDDPTGVTATASLDGGVALLESLKKQGFDTADMKSVANEIMEMRGEIAKSAAKARK